MDHQWCMIRTNFDPMAGKVEKTTGAVFNVKIDIIGSEGYFLKLMFGNDIWRFLADKSH